MAIKSSNDSNKEKYSRRKVLKALLATGSIMSLPCALLIPKASYASSIVQFNPDAGSGMYGRPFKLSDYTMFRNACPRNCFDTCSIQSYIKDGIVRFVEGAQSSTYTNGGLCVKGYSYLRRIYSPDRIKYPMMQDGRRSGRWRRVSWEEAMSHIATKILDLKKRDGNTLGLALTKYSGNFGITNYCVEGMMSSIGYTSRFIGTPCWPAGIDAQTYDFGAMWANDPEDMAQSRYVILWGANPAACSMHSMKYIYEAKSRGAKIVVIDPVLTETAAKADLFWQAKVASDGALALGMARHILDKKLYDADFVTQYAQGFEEFASYLRNNISVEWAAQTSGIPAHQIRMVAEEFATAKPATVWIGYGMQRHTNGGAMVRSIDALVAMCGHVGKVGGGARYGQVKTWDFAYNAMNQKPPQGSTGVIVGDAAKAKGEFGHNASEAEGNLAAAIADEHKTEHITYGDRLLNINKTAQEILDINAGPIDKNNPKISMLWSSCKNPFAQDFDRHKLERAFDSIDTVISVEQFFTETVANSDIVLPVTTLFEEWTVNVSYWNYWLSINEQAIKPMHEAKSNLHIAALLSRTMNAMEQGSCTFPQDVDEQSFTAKEFSPAILDQFGLTRWEELLNGPRKSKLAAKPAWHDFVFQTPSGKYEFRSDLCAEHGHNALPVYVPPRKPYAPYRLLTPHTKFGIHSQFINLDWMRDVDPQPFVYLHPRLAEAKSIREGDIVRVFNDLGDVVLRARISTNVQADCLVMYEAWYGGNVEYNVQNCVDDEAADMGRMATGAPGVAIHDQFADIERV
ncbi:MAG: molybdopterin-dependent oxidoreductase [Pseudomonadota bacterium]